MKILFASSERDLLMTYSRLLEAEGFPVLTAFDGPGLISQLGAERLLVICDALLPRLDTRQLLRFLKEEKMPVLLLLDEKPAPPLYRELLPENAFLYYPFSPRELIGRVRSLLANTESEADAS